MMQDPREVTKIPIFLDGTGPNSIKDLNIETLRRFEAPTKEDVFRSLRHELEKSEGSDQMVVNLEGSRLVALRVADGDLDAEWEQVPPVDGWKNRDRDKGYFYFFVFEPEIGWAQNLQNSFVVKGELRDKRTQLSDYLGLYVHVAANGEKYERDEVSTKRGFMVSRCSFAKNSEADALKRLYDEPGKQSMSGNPARTMDTLISMKGSLISLYFNWPDSSEGQHPYGKEIWAMENRMALLAIGGEFYPKDLRERATIWDEYFMDGVELAGRLREETVFSMSEQLVDHMEKVTFGDSKSAMQMLASGLFTELWNSPHSSISIQETNVGVVLGDQMGLIMKGLQYGNGRYSIGDWNFEISFPEKSNSNGLFRVEGLKISNNKVKGIKMLLTRFEQEILSGAGVDDVMANPSEIKINLVQILRDQDEPDDFTLESLK